MATAIIDNEGRIAFSSDFLKDADLAPGEAVDVALVAGTIVLRRPPDDPENDPEWLYSDKFVRGVEEAIADIKAGRSTFHASTEDFLASLRARESSEAASDADA